ncbi:hypothetical protein ECC02_003900 [Trypanosoma cruzi]|uniref:Uncharacterized protein n=1 Tax=Trypanosoma cruzi TaxID=5693 RepID=A0A7J6Y927_TRYCR|nr:hypothetical protein ECC02_003900 [Trypanosoma cruzi]
MSFAVSLFFFFYVSCFLVAEGYFYFVLFFFWEGGENMSSVSRAPWRRLLFLFISTLFCALRSPAMADTVTLTDPTTGEVVLLTSGKLHSSATSSSSVVGLWPHGDGRDDDTAFFKREDDAYEEWTKKKKKQMQWEQQQRKENENEGKDNDKKESSKKASRSKLEEFSAEAVKSRSKARRQHLNELKNISSFEIAWSDVRADSDRVEKFLHDFSSSAPDGVPGGGPEEQYTHLLKTVFRHTVRNMTNKEGFLWIEKRMCALPYPMVLDGKVVERVEREVREIKERMNKLDLAWRAANITENLEDINSTMMQIRESLSESEEIINASREAHKIVLELVLPLIPNTRQSVANQLREINAKIVGNDESTAQLRQQLKEWTRRKSLLKASNEKIMNVELELRRAVYSNSLLSERDFVFSLALIARARLGQNTGIEIVDVVTGLGTCVSLTAAQEAELKETLSYPLGITLLTVGSVGWVMLEARAFWLKRVRKSLASLQRPPDVGGHPRRQFSFVRLCLRVNLLLEAMVPLVVPSFLLYTAVNNKKGEVSLYSILLFSRPAQRLAMFGVAVAFCILSIIVSSLVGALYRYASASSPRRKVKNN